ncbi:MAG: LacI family transcriptional regulator [Microbacteriaceae bacterium]|nr:MAG: LacI family transcriptional regulator [Microbacteriaceae bacterium]
MVTQQDVADRAGVGRRTVSHVVTGFPHVSPEARERVLRAIDELGYVPNRAAQQLRTGRSGVIALSVPQIGVGYFGELGALLIEEAASRGLGLLIGQTLGSRDRESVEIERILALQPEGMILSPLGLTAADVEQIAARTPVTLIGEHFIGHDIPGVGESIVIDNVRGSLELVRHLAQSGRRRVAYVGMPAEVAPRFDALRREGTYAGRAAEGLEPVADLLTADYTWEEGYRVGREAAHRVAAGELDAVSCVTDEVAIGVMRALHDAGLRIPTDVAVAGSDGIPEGLRANPRLTTVAPDKVELARRAVAAVIGEPVPEGFVPHRVVLREST